MINSLMRWNPFGEIRRIQEEMNRLFDTTFAAEEGELSATGWLPAVDIEETPDSLRVIAELPGIRKEDINVEYENGLLTIRGERRREEEKREKNFHRVERSFGTFMRSFRLPATVDAEKIVASYEDGVLRLEMPKHEESKPRRIAISGSAKQLEAKAGKSS